MWKNQIFIFSHFPENCHGNQRVKFLVLYLAVMRNFSFINSILVVLIYCNPMVENVNEIIKTVESNYFFSSGTKHLSKFLFKIK